MYVCGGWATSTYVGGRPMGVGLQATCMCVGGRPMCVGGGATCTYVGGRHSVGIHENAYRFYVL